MIIKNPSRIRANALVITVIISILLSILSGFLILLAYYNRSLEMRTVLNEKLDRNLSSAIALVLADTSEQHINTFSSLDLFGKGNDSVIIHKKPWGIYGIAIAQSIDGERSKVKKFLYGASLPSYMDGSVYLVDHDRPLFVSGHTNLIGNAYLPKGGLRPAYIDQRGYDRSELLEGQIRTSEKLPPPLSDPLKQYLTLLLDTDTASKKNTDYTYEDSLFRSFEDSVLIIDRFGKMEIQNIKISGQVMLRSDSLIEIDPSALLNNVIVIAPVVRIKNGFRGTIQTIASDSIIVGENCRLEYPSTLVLLKKTRSFQPEMSIGKYSIIEGGIFSFAEADDIRKTSITMADGSMLTGVAYLNGFFALKGNVSGSVLTDYFLYKTPASVYENHLVDVLIDRKKLSRYYAGPLIFSERKFNKIIQWVN